MESVIDFKNMLVKLNQDYAINDFNKFKSGQLKEVCGDMLNMLTFANVTIDNLVKGNDELLAIKSSINELHDAIENRSPSNDEPAANRTYSAVLKTSNKETVISDMGKQHIVRDRQVLIVKPRPGVSVSEAEADIVKNEISEALGSVPISNFRKTQRGAFVLELPNSKFMNKAKDHLDTHFKDDQNFTVNKPLKVLPKMTIVGVPSEMSNENIVKAICEKNDEINNYVMSGCILSVVFSRATINEEKTVVLKMAPEIRSAIKDIGGFVHIGMVRCRAYDRFWVTRCYYCQKYGHISSKCPNINSSAVCSYCSLAHKSQDCTSRDALCCRNCVDSGVPDADTKHSSSDKVCPKFIFERQRLIENTNFSSSKNLSLLNLATSV
jgi:hypothetical protein